MTPRQQASTRAYAASVRAWRRAKNAKLTDAELDRELIAARRTIQLPSALARSWENATLRAAACRIEMQRRVLATG